MATPVALAFGKVTALFGGWTEPYLRVQTDAPVPNPAICPLSDGYIVEATLPAAQLFHSMLLTAFASGRPVQLTVDGCFLDRPRVIGVVVTTP
ncbi:MAG: hypothetical protein J7521_02110 [Caulobacter sp.]|nr:hypothetical protein [Caulobacter sp.]